MIPLHDNVRPHMQLTKETVGEFNIQLRDASVSSFQA